MLVLYVALTLTKSANFNVSQYSCAVACLPVKQKVVTDQFSVCTTFTCSLFLFSVYIPVLLMLCAHRFCNENDFCN